MFKDFVHQVVQPWLRDRERLRHRLRLDVQRRHATHPPAAASVAPDLVAGRGGLLDLAALRWLDAIDAERAMAALDFLLETLSAAEEILGHVAHRLSHRLQDRISHVPRASLLEGLFAHARW
ncbi:MAG: hypothetical protein E6I75_13140, partial [Chloroflexi bacterium]